jgi:K+-transporting ATPase ATPase C chain
MMLVFTVVLGLAYPVVVLGVSQVLFKDKANGSLVTNSAGQVVGSALLGQQFTGDQWFQGRPSAAGTVASGSLDADGKPGDPTDLTQVNSGGSNLGPTNDSLVQTVQQRVDDYRKANGLGADDAVPVDAVTASGSGVDPYISVANARLQAPRVAAARHLNVDQVSALIDANTHNPSLGFLGETGVDVLQLNLALGA